MSLTAYQGGSSSTSGTTATPTPVNNVQAVIMDYGPSVNGQQVGNNDSLYTTVTICVPGTTTCQSIDHVLVDTGSTGLRILSSELALTLPYSTDANSNPIGNCIQYADSTYQWGPVATADIKMVGEVASFVPIQIVAPSNFPAAPRSCRAGGTPAQTVLELGANGILGVGLFRQDCGPACASPSSAPAVYFRCPSSGCTVAAVALSAQLQNPVWMFPQDNNGLAIILPQVSATGAVSVTGSMIFGIGTQSNNALNGAQAQAADDLGNFTTTFNGVAYSNSFIDSGSNGFFFLDSVTTGLPDCGSTSIAPGFYCPTSPVSFTAINAGPNPNGSNISVSENIAFSVANGVSLINSPEVAFNNLGGDNPGGFDWGLPFFFGRTVFIGIEGQSSAAGTGPFWATIASTSDCTYQLSLGGQAFPAAGGNGSVAIITAPGCPWSVDNLPSWAALTSPASGTGNGTVTFQVLANGGSDLTNTFEIAGQTFTVEQETGSIVGLNLVGAIADIAAQENWTTMFTLVNKGGASTQARLSLFGDDIDPSGNGPLMLPFAFPQQPPAAGPLLAASFDRTLNANASLIVNTAGPQTPPVLQGSAQLAATGPLDGFAIFHHVVSLQEAVVPMETRNASYYLLAFDNTNGLVLGVAVENVSAQNAVIGVVIRDDTGTLIGSPGATISLGGNGHTSFVLSDPVQGFPITANKRGTIEFDTPAGGQISVLGIRFTPPNNALTTIPALANVGTGGGSIAHLASGGDGWQTTFVLVNVGSSAAQATLSFFADTTGNPLSLPLSFPQSGSGTTTVASSVTQTLAAGATLLVQSSGAVNLLTGSAQLSTTGNVSGFVIFRHNNQEAVVPLESRTASAYILAFDNTNGTFTGVAVNAASTQQVNIPVVVRNDAGTQIASGLIPLAANGHSAFTLAVDKFPETAGIRGTIEFDTPANAQIGALGIRIPTGIAHTYTTLPALAK